MGLANFKIVFDRNDRATASKPDLVQIACYRTGYNRVWVSTGIKIYPNQWDKKNSRISEKHPQYFELNNFLKSVLDKFQSYDSMQLAKNVIVPLQFFKTFINSNDTNSFIEFFEKEFKENPNFAGNTIKNYQSALNHITKYGTLKYFSDLTYTNLEGFNRYLLNLKLKDNTIEKYHKALKKTVNEAIRKGFIEKQNNPYENFSFRSKAVERECLTNKDIVSLEKLNIADSNYGLKRTRDMFLFCVYTCLRYSDLIQVSNKTIKFKDDGIYMDIISQKTKKKIAVNLRLFFPGAGKYSKPEEIINKYKDILAIEPFKISLPTYNYNLKKIAAQAKIDIKLTSHIARYTFLTFMADKVSLKALQELAQHSDIKTTMQYVKMSEKMKQAELKKVNWEL